MLMRVSTCSFVGLGCHRHGASHGVEVKRAGGPQGPGQRTTSFRETEAIRVAVQRGTAAGEPAVGVDDEDAVHHDHPQQIGSCASLPTPHAGAGRRRGRSRGQAYRSPGPGPSVAPGAPAAGPAGSGAVSLRMSMRHPVRRAASRAFCPSLPIASESW